MSRFRKLLYDEKRVFGLDLMRCAAILMVLFGHCVWMFPHSDNALIQILHLMVYLGVEVFFVLSGFLIGRIMYSLFVEQQFTAKSVLRFLKRRWYRTLPNYFLILVINLLIASAIGYGVDQVWRYFIFMQNFAWPLLPFFPESWSLSVEEFAYILLPAILLFCAVVFKFKNKRAIFFLATIGVIMLCIIAKVAWHVQTGNTDIDYWNLALKSVVVYRVDAIFIGVLFSWIYWVFPKFWNRFARYLAMAGVIMMAFFAVGIGYLGLFIERYPFFWNVLYLPVTSFSIALFLPLLSNWKAERQSIRNPITFISLISYSIYLLHYSIVMQLLKQLIDTDRLNTIQLAILTAFYISLTIALSFLLFTYYEKPMTDKRNKG